MQYSSLFENAVVNSLDAVDIGEEMLVRVEVECGREEPKDREKQEKNKHEETDKERSNTHHGWHEDGLNVRYTDTLGSSS